MVMKNIKGYALANMSIGYGANEQGEPIVSVQMKYRDDDGLVQELPLVCVLTEYAEKWSQAVLEAAREAESRVHQKTSTTMLEYATAKA